MAADTATVGEFSDGNIGVVCVGLSCAMAGFTAYGFVFEFSDFLIFVRMAFVARFPAGKDRLSSGNFQQRFSPVPAELAKGWGGEEITSDEIGTDDACG
jgi:hypothetical protein